MKNIHTSVHIKTMCMYFWVVSPSGFTDVYVGVYTWAQTNLYSRKFKIAFMSSYRFWLKFKHHMMLICMLFIRVVYICTHKFSPKSLAMIEFPKKKCDFNRVGMIYTCKLKRRGTMWIMVKLEQRMMFIRVLFNKVDGIYTRKLVWKLYIMRDFRHRVEFIGMLFSRMYCFHRLFIKVCRPL